MRPGVLGVLISGNGSTLQALIDSQDAFRIKLIISSNPQAYGLKRAGRAGIPIAILPQEFLGRGQALLRDQWIVERFLKVGVTQVFLAGYMSLVSQKLIDAMRGEIFNIHPSLLPQYKGLHALDQALKANENFLGVTVHRVTQELDAGPVIAQKKFVSLTPKTVESNELWQHIHEQRVLHSVAARLMWQKPPTL